MDCVSHPRLRPKLGIYPTSIVIPQSLRLSSRELVSCPLGKYVLPAASGIVLLFFFAQCACPISTMCVLPIHGSERSLYIHKGSLGDDSVT